MIVFAGLGNPGASYRGHRHNVGFMAVDVLHAHYRFPAWRARFHGLAAEGLIGGEKVLLLKPTTFMNESGRSVGEALRFFKLAPSALTVFHDELDLAPGKVRAKVGGGTAGHNGLKSIAAHLGPDFRRVRIGIGHPGDKARVHGYVLSDFAKADEPWLVPLLDALADAAPLLVAGDDSRFMTRVAHLTHAPAPEKDV